MYAQLQALADREYDHNSPADVGFGRAGGSNKGNALGDVDFATRAHYEVLCLKHKFALARARVRSAYKLYV